MPTFSRIPIEEARAMAPSSRRVAREHAPPSPRRPTPEQASPSELAEGHHSITEGAQQTAPAKAAGVSPASQWQGSIIRPDRVRRKGETWMEWQTALAPDDQGRVKRLLQAAIRSEMQRQGSPVTEETVVGLVLHELQQAPHEPWVARATTALALDGIRRVNARAAQNDPHDQNGFRDLGWLAAMSGVPQAMAALAAAGYAWAGRGLLELAAAGLATALEELIREAAAAEGVPAPQSWEDVDAELRVRRAYADALARLHQLFPDAATPGEALARTNIRPDDYGDDLATLTERLEHFLAGQQPPRSARARAV